MKNTAYYDYGTGEIRKDFFLTVLNTKSESYSKRKDYKGVYFSTDDLKTILGRRNYLQRLEELYNDGYISQYSSPLIKSKYGRKLYFVKPISKPSKITNTVTDITFINVYYEKRLKMIEKNNIEYQYNTLKNTTFNLSEVNFVETRTEDVEYYNSVLARLNRFNHSTGIEKVLHLSKDSFSGRIHSIVTNIPKEYRENIVISGKPTFEIDLKQAQIVIFSEILLDSIGNNSFSNMVISGVDVYEFIKEKFELNSRDEAKEYMFSMLFGKPDSKKALELYNIFPDIKEFVIDLKTKPLAGNDRANYTNLAFLLQTQEVELFGKVWASLEKQGIEYLSVHDSIISNNEKAKEIIKIVLERELSVQPVLNTK